MKNNPKAYKALYEVRRIRDLRDLMKQSVDLYSNRIAIKHKPEGKDNYQDITYKQLSDNVNELGTALWELGLSGEKIVIIGENRYEWAISFLATANGLGIVVPIDKELPSEEIQNLLKISNAQVVIYSEKIKDKLFNDMESSNVKFYINMDNKKDEKTAYTISDLLEKGKNLLEQGKKEYLEAEIDPEKMNFLFFTSATTDFAKGVMHNHKALCENLQAMSSMVYIGDDIFLSILPLHHTYECVCGFLCPIYRGCTIAYCEGLRYIVQNMKEAKVTMILAVPLIIESMYKRIWKQAEKTGLDKRLIKGLKISNTLLKVGIDIRKKIFKPIHDTLGGHMRLFVSGAAGIDPEISKGIRDMGIACLQGYGLTECAPIIALNRDIYYRDDSAGLPMPGIDIKINNPDIDGIGEIIARGPNVMLGYYENEELTSKALKDGWYHTGDLGYMNEEGFVFITGRKKNMILTKNGKNVFPEEIETYLNRSRYILESLVFGKTDKKNEILINAQIYPDSESIEEKLGQNYSAQELKELIGREIKKVNSKMPLYKKITGFNIREKEFIKTTTRKIKRYMENVD